LVVAKHLYGAIDAGLIVNPAFVENQISGQLIQAVSRMLKIKESNCCPIVHVQRFLEDQEEPKKRRVSRRHPTALDAAEKMPKTGS
jgi:hypothetical protein